MKMLIAVMSYNRGEFLWNCVSSIKRNFNFKYSLHIYDDNSTDEATKEVLNVLSGEGHIVINTNSEGSSMKHKGLYRNMNRALQYCIENSFEGLFIIQDDMQVIRSINENAISRFINAFKVPGNALIVPLFFKKNHRKDYASLLNYSHDFDGYIPKSKEQIYMWGLADVGIFNVQLLNKINWNFAEEERLNILKGKSFGLYRVVLKDPFLAYLPWPKTHRFKLSKFADLVTMVTDLIFKAGFHPLNDITPENFLKMKSRQPDEIPFEEDYLTIKGETNLYMPWNYYRSSYWLKDKIRKLIKI